MGSLLSVSFKASYCRSHRAARSSGLAVQRLLPAQKCEPGERETQPKAQGLVPPPSFLSRTQRLLSFLRSFCLCTLGSGEVEPVSIPVRSRVSFGFKFLHPPNGNSRSAASWEEVEGSTGLGDKMNTPQHGPHPRPGVGLAVQLSEASGQTQGLHVPGPSVLSHPLTLFFAPT